MMRSVFDIGHSHFVVGCPSAKHNENFSERCKGQVQLEFGQFFNDLRELNRPRTAIDLYGQTTPLPSMLRIFSLDAILPLTHADRSEEHTSELQSLMRSSYAVFCLKKKNI